MQGRTLAHKPLDPEIAALADRHGRDPEAILTIFQELQARHGGLSQAAVTDVARALRVPAQRAFGVATFYSMLVMPPRAGQTLRVCDGPACWLRGVAQARGGLEARCDGQAHIERSSCLGLCDRAPAALIDDDPCGPLAPESAPANEPCGPAATYPQPRPGEMRVLLARAGRIDPDEIDTAVALGAYRGLHAALAGAPEAVIATIEASGLQGRGGAGFPTGRKLRFVAQAERRPKYVVCNADESEPLIFKDRVLIDSDPHLILEGMALAAYAVGAREGFVYIRGEYAAQAARLKRAVRQAEERGWLGERIRDTDFSFHVHVHRGAGAYICGEETALLESLEGKRGEPRLRPPYPPTAGYRGCPTLVNNVETFANVAAVAANGADWYRGLSPAATPGTKLYMLLGHVQRPGLFEAPFGLTLRQILEDFGGGMAPGSKFHLALTGGAAGTIIPESLLDVPIDYASVRKGVSLGAGAFLICDETVSPVALLRELLRFFEAESCGKCTPCRGGTHEAREILDRLAAGQGQAGDAARLARLADLLSSASFCGLGQSVAIPMRSALAHFADRFQV